jgi:hypothetical protein
MRMSANPNILAVLARSHPRRLRTLIHASQ